VASSHLSSIPGGGFSGTDVNGGDFMGAAGGQCWFFASETTFHGTAADTIDFYMISVSGERFHLAGPFTFGGDFPGGYFAGNTCGLSIKNRGPVFCTVFSIGGKGGLWTKSSGGWINTFQTAGGAVGVGKIKKSAPAP
jgi:hypothetical protein